MNIIEKHEYFKKGLVMSNTNVTMQNFFKTNPTSEQLLLISKMFRDDSISCGIGLFMYLILGVLVGLAVSMSLWG